MKARPAAWATLTCRVRGHRWIDQQFHSASGSRPFSACRRCGAYGAPTDRGQHKIAQAARR